MSAIPVILVFKLIKVFKVWALMEGNWVIWGSRVIAGVRRGVDRLRLTKKGVWIVKWVFVMSFLVH